MKSFYTILKEGTLEVKHEGEVVNLILPDWFIECGPHLENVEGLRAWATEHNSELGVYHAGIQKILINMRQEARPKHVTKDGVTTKPPFIADEAQARLNKFAIEPVKRPGETKAAEKAKIEAETTAKNMADMKIAMLASGMKAEAIDKIMTTF